MKESSNYLIIWNKIITITCFDSPDKHCSASTLNTIFSLTRSYQWVPCCSLSHLVLENIRNPFWGFGDMELGVILKQMRKVSAKSVAEIMLKTPVLVIEVEQQWAMYLNILTSYEDTVSNLWCQIKLPSSCSWLQATTLAEQGHPAVALLEHEYHILRRPSFIGFDCLKYLLFIVLRENGLNTCSDASWTVHGCRGCPGTDQEDPACSCLQICLLIFVFEKYRLTCSDELKSHLTHVLLDVFMQRILDSFIHLSLKSKLIHLHVTWLNSIITAI